jgi:multidrug transporter EmrE-like cation transporter
MKTSPVAIACFLVAALLGAAGQYLYKTGADAGGYLTNWRFYGGVVCYIAVMALFVAGFKSGGNLSVLYPLYASTFIWGALISRFAFHTPITPANVAGMALLVVGMFLMGLR